MKLVAAWCLGCRRWELTVPKKQYDSSAEVRVAFAAQTKQHAKTCKSRVSRGTKIIEEGLVLDSFRFGINEVRSV